MTKPSTKAYIIKTTCRYNRDRTQNKWFLSQQSRQKRHKIKIGIFTTILHFPDHTLKLKAPDQPQSAREESYLTRDIT